MGWLADTGVWIAVERGRVSAADIHAITGTDVVYLSPVNVAELQFGIERMTDPRRRLRAQTLLKRLQRKPLLRIDAGTGQVFGQLAAALESTGRGADFRAQDIWLAAQAVQRDFALLATNARDFSDVPGLKVVPLPLS
jgi:predicted nucleic acid-binding protein